MREVKVLNAMYLELVKNLEVLKMTLLEDTPIIQVVDYPILPLQSIKKPIFWVFIFGLSRVLSYIFLHYSKEINKRCFR